MTRIVIGADLVPYKRHKQALIEGNIDAVIDSGIKELFEKADYRVVNMELPLIKEQTPIEKCGPNLGAGTEAIKGYQALNIDLVTIANNHVLDHGKKGFDSTIETLNSVGLAYVGGGYTYEDAYAPKIVELGGKKIGFYATCQHEFSWVQDYGFGSNGFDPLETPDHLVQLKKECDYVIVLYHAGVEHYPYPTPRMRKECRKMVEKGADLVICQHTHCVDCEEKYKGGTICYGQGDFIFDHGNSEALRKSLLVTVDFDENGFKVNYHAIERQEDGFITLAKDNSILEGFYKRSEEIKEEGFVEQKLEEQGDGNMLRCYLDAYRGYFDSGFYRFVWKLTNKKCANVLLGKKSRVRLINYINNPAHGDMILAGIKAYQKRVWKQENDKNNLFDK